MICTIYFIEIFRDTIFLSDNQRTKQIYVKGDKLPYFPVKMVI